METLPGGRAHVIREDATIILWTIRIFSPFRQAIIFSWATTATFTG
jgi:hypothetical protein